ncbi:hypothetical protein BKA62DRAFT_92864 [Auriculariales sp. MPI-PUGE-AT-0066]|nr:hypothetical protein BKA62DRAFT_92864 [Auriculariales sp. MPI-PUGE-AT-0066]
MAKCIATGTKRHTGLECIGQLGPGVGRVSKVERSLLDVESRHSSDFITVERMSNLRDLHMLASSYWYLPFYTIMRCLARTPSSIRRLSFTHHLSESSFGPPTIPRLNDLVWLHIGGNVILELLFTTSVLSHLTTLVYTPPAVDGWNNTLRRHLDDVLKIASRLDQLRTFVIRGHSLLIHNVYAEPMLLSSLPQVVQFTYRHCLLTEVPRYGLFVDVFESRFAAFVQCVFPKLHTLELCICEETAEDLARNMPHTTQSLDAIERKKKVWVEAFERLVLHKLPRSFSRLLICGCLVYQQ